MNLWRTKWLIQWLLYLLFPWLADKPARGEHSRYALRTGAVTKFAIESNQNQQVVVSCTNILELPVHTRLTLDLENGAALDGNKVRWVIGTQASEDAPAQRH